jgi:prevent-host-death family protein
MEKIMITITATKLRNNLFNYLEKVTNGETILIQRNKKEVAKLVPPNTSNWRDNLKTKMEILVEPDELIKPLEDIWEDYV